MSAAPKVPSGIEAYFLAQACRAWMSAPHDCDRAEYDALVREIRDAAILVVGVRQVEAKQLVCWDCGSRRLRWLMSCDCPASDRETCNGYRQTEYLRRGYDRWTAEKMTEDPCDCPCHDSFEPEVDWYAEHRCDRCGGLRTCGKADCVCADLTANCTCIQDRET